MKWSHEARIDELADSNEPAINLKKVYLKLILGNMLYIRITMYKMAMIPEIYFIDRIVRKLENTVFVAGLVANVVNANVQDPVGYGFQIFNVILQNQLTFSLIHSFLFLFSYM